MKTETVTFGTMEKECLAPAVASSKVHCGPVRFALRCCDGKSISRFLLFLALPLLFVNAYADPLPVGFSSSLYTTFVSVSCNGADGPTNQFRTTISSSPTGDDLILVGPGSGGESEAHSSFFGVEAYSAVFGGQGTASATNLISFAPVTDQTQSLDFQFSSVARYYYSSGSVRLFDQTSATELWNYYWDGSTSGNVPWVSTNFGFTATAQLNLQTDFYAAHVYELTMNTSVGSASDTVQAQIELLGLQAIPEPSSIALLLTALPALFAIRRRIKP